MQKITDVYTHDPCYTPAENSARHMIGAQIWYKNGSIHRDGDLPAVITADGSMVFYCNDGICHRDGDLPAMEQFDVCKVWYVHGKIHRERGPAKIVFQPFSSTEYFYYQHGLLHRDERDVEGNLLPAIFTEPSDSDEQFFLEGCRMNRDGTPYQTAN